MGTELLRLGATYCTLAMLLSGTVAIDSASAQDDTETSMQAGERAVNEDADKLVQAFDANGDGALDSEERAALFRAVRSLARPDAEGRSREMRRGDFARRGRGPDRRAAAPGRFGGPRMAWRGPGGPGMPRGGWGMQRRGPMDRPTPAFAARTAAPRLQARGLQRHGGRGPAEHGRFARHGREAQRARHVAQHARGSQGRGPDAMRGGSHALDRGRETAHGRELARDRHHDGDAHAREQGRGEMRHGHGRGHMGGRHFVHARRPGPEGGSEMHGRDERGPRAPHRDGADEDRPHDRRGDGPPHGEFRRSGPPRGDDLPRGPRDDDRRPPQRRGPIGASDTPRDGAAAPIESAPVDAASVESALADEPTTAAPVEVPAST